ncbi:MAG: cobalamin-binding protein [Deltaproteobacteria bacterium]|nr:cobalamin-binding protein [Deltaproteobacteria bacterium]
MTLRIASLIASATETIAALGLADLIVGVSHECDSPPEAIRGRPVLTRAKINITRASLDIHRDVEAIVANGLSVYEIDVAALAAARPTHIVTQDQCQVCAVTFDDVVRATKACLAADARIITLHPDTLDDIFADLRKVAAGLGVPERGEALAADLRRAVACVAVSARALVPKPRVICLEWTNPLMVAGNWMPELVELAGGVNGITAKGDHTQVVSWAKIQAFDPDLICVMPCGYPIAQALANRADLESLPGWADLRAVRRGQVYCIDGNTYMNRPGPRIVESFYILAGLLHPTEFGHLMPPGAAQRWPAT